MGKRAWHIADKYEESGELVGAYDQVVDLASSLIDTLRVVGGQLNVATLRHDTGEKIGGVKVFETTGYLVSFTDTVPGVRPPAPPPVELDESDEGEQEEEE